MRPFLLQHEKEETSEEGIFVSKVGERTEADIKGLKIHDQILKVSDDVISSRGESHD